MKNIMNLNIINSNYNLKEPKKDKINEKKKIKNSLKIYMH